MRGRQTNGESQGLGLQKRGVACRGSGRSFLPEFRPKYSGPAPTVLHLPPSPSPSNSPPLPSPPSWPARGHGLIATTAWVSMGMGVLDRWATPLGELGHVVQPTQGCVPNSESCCCPVLMS